MGVHTHQHTVETSMASPRTGSGDSSPGGVSDSLIGIQLRQQAPSELFDAQVEETGILHCEVPVQPQHFGSLQSGNLVDHSYSVLPEERDRLLQSQLRKSKMTRHSKKKKQGKRINHVLRSPSFPSPARKGQFPCSPKQRLGRRLQQFKARPTTPIEDIKHIKRVAWSLDEKTFVKKYVQDHGGPDEVSWEDCSAALTEKCGVLRTDKACMSTFRRLKLLGLDAPTLLPTHTAVIETQTELSFCPSDAVWWESLTDAAAPVSIPGIANTASHSTSIPTSQCSTLRSILEQDVHTSPHSLCTGVKSSTSTTMAEESTAPNKVSTPLSASTPSSQSMPVALAFCGSIADEHSYSTQATASSSNHPELVYAKSTHGNSNRAKRLRNKRGTVHKLMEKSLSRLSVLNTPKLGLKDSVRLKLLARTRDPLTLSKFFLTVPCLREVIIDVLCDSVGEQSENMKNRLHGDVSVLMKKDFAAMENFDLSKLVQEMKYEFPELLKMLVAVMVPKEKRTDPVIQSQLVPRLGIIYACMMQAHNPELSLLQRVVS